MEMVYTSATLQCLPHRFHRVDLDTSDMEVKMMMKQQQQHKKTKKRYM